jgi:hypothetical protein
MRLEIEIVPKSSHYQNMRKVLSKDAWDLLRRSIYRKYNYRCGVCNAKGRMNCHEIWEYDDTRGVQTLKGYEALCDMCHHVRHIGYASVLASQGKLDYEKVVQHFCKVNKCKREKFDEHVNKAYKIGKERSALKWRVDMISYHQNKNDFITKEIIP